MAGGAHQLAQAVGAGFSAASKLGARADHSVHAILDGVPARCRGGRAGEFRRAGGEPLHLLQLDAVPRCGLPITASKPPRGWVSCHRSHTPGKATSQWRKVSRSAMFLARCQRVVNSCMRVSPIVSAAGPSRSADAGCKPALPGDAEICRTPGCALVPCEPALPEEDVAERS